MAIVRAELAAPAVRVLALRAELVDSGPAAVELGLLDELAEPDALLDRALEVAGGFAALPRAAYARVKDAGIQKEAEARAAQVERDRAETEKWRAERLADQYKEAKLK